MANFWWAFDTGAYENKTGHLTILEDGAYFRLLRHYYKTAMPIPEQSTQIIRISGAHSEEEIAAVQFILATFFRLKSDGWHNKRADEELIKARKVSKLRKELGQRGGLAKAKAIAVAKAVANGVAKGYTVTVTDTYTKPKSKANTVSAQFIPPSIAEVGAYCRERGNRIDAEHFVSHYAARGWKYSGGIKMSDWKKAIITWEKRDGRTNPDQRPTQTRPPSAVVARFQNNRAERERAFGAAVGSETRANGDRQTSGLGTGNSLVLEGEVKKLP